MRHLIGLPYDKVNCWDLARLYYREFMGCELQHYFEGTPTHRSETQTLIYSNIGDFEKVEGDPEVGDLIVIRVLGLESHIAVYIGDGRMLHTSKRIGSHLERVDSYKKLISGYYRLRPKDD